MSTPNPKPVTTDDKKEQEVLSALRGIRYGAVEVIIHNREIVQIVRTERHRLDSQQTDDKR